MRLCWLVHSEDLVPAPSLYGFIADNECNVLCLVFLPFSEAAVLLTWKCFPTMELSIRTQILFKMLNATRCLLSVGTAPLYQEEVSSWQDSDSLWHWLIHGTYALIFTSSSWSCFRLHFHYSSTLGEVSSASTDLTRKPQRLKRSFIAVMILCSSPLQLHFENKRPRGKVASHKQNLQLCSHRGLMQIDLTQMPGNMLPTDTSEQPPKLLPNLGWEQCLFLHI